MNLDSKIRKLSSDITDCQTILTALGDESRQHIILEMLKVKNCSGARVGEIASCTSLSRPAVSHHLQILKKAGILKVRKEGTMNFYYFDADMKSFGQLIHMLTDAQEIMLQLPNRSGDD
ncbi:MAG: hypothetical protein PWP16_665 [Eubacteriaceae bacterium]|jgi:DNA-binding transcriptional ArsR family regulator|nr:hypothetical protein [Eubacteriaceae bacterium]MDK2904434.1 hypothetical protein [Eubacteriaceae bacterium]MDK2937362.1 hypothetical protein [Eubacteriaceae bacterium]MDK2961622.1 hypothetical protein [Eubacteriaceae bacterium]MDN5307302.1 hypothetical protein [Eubacteriaceae bacterium]